ncbi:ATP-binding protein involved in chromosome partitioning [Povalibacter uvarum]|uniref:Iron-sulfur cluster carrier protein n=1 Tax=Povalibacter uvarum TaxID=732238 RepID=A0A841HH50_9GAMM|nr:iron-sulfur cluster carrier protein ApbC [Povalibacter uvarum]MBB6091415.1 ATP-binding protein involved in chromosome partitioning [Povalibacter uvarum]
MTTERDTAVRRLVESFREPYLDRELGAVGAVENVTVAGGNVRLNIRLGFPARRYASELTAALSEQVRSLGWVEAVDVDVQWKVESQAVKNNLRPIQAIRNIIAVASGKGGVGKSTTAANLALALAHEGAAVGLLDADIYGPSQPRMMGLGGERPVSPDQKSMIAPEAFGVKVMSIGFLIDEEQPMVWRGPMVTQALVQLLETTRWGELDYLIVDMPPGTGDTQLTLSQRVPVSGAVIVTTPQDIALLDARKGLRMFEKVEVPVLGIVENMSTHVCSNCGHEEHIFGSGGGRRMAQQYGVDLLAELPLDIRIREEMDRGEPTVVAEPDSPLGRAYIDLGRRTAARLARRSFQPDAPFPTIEVEDT